MTEHIVNCRTCEYASIQPDMQNADLARDQHEKGMFNWRGDSEPCGPCAISRLNMYGSL